MSEKREEVYQILELGKHEENLHHKKGFGGLLFIDLSMIKFSNLSSYIRQLDKENQELKQQLHDASIQIQELMEKDIWCPNNCEKLEKLQQENEKLKDNWDKLKEYTQEKYDNPSWASCGARYVLEKMRELQGSDSDE